MARKTKAPVADAPPATENVTLTQDRSARDEAATFAALEEAQAARRKQTRDDLQTGLDEARKLGEQSKDLLIGIVELGARLAAIEQTKAAIRSRIVDACHREAVAHSGFRARGADIARRGPAATLGRRPRPHWRRAS